MAEGNPAKRDEAVERLTNLSFALQGAAHGGGSPDRSAAWIRKNVEGYQNRSDEAFLKQLSRDVVTLQRAGVPVVHSSGEDGSMYRLNQDEYQLPPVDFTPEEAMVLGVAGGIGKPGGLSDFTLSAWTKIAASGASRDLSGAPVYVAVNDITRISPELTTAVITAVRAHLRITFDYYATPSSPAVRRTMDPWGLVNHNSRVYLVGWDVDREAARVFRATRIDNVKRSRQDATHLTVPGPLQDLVVEALQRGETVDALVSIPQGSALELAAAGKQREDGLYAMNGVEKDWLVRTAASYAPGVEVLEPAEVRAAIIELLTAERPQEGEK
ncbi:helix-turn-helix transcriptional regulator [Corynebacterium striatum]|uniref:helix-turn-helix transcriptional regulator n=1 Tax=Corynebacterium TaxID=1716 RepID=UPI000673D044|nr:MULTISPECIES: WYL domain-containing protein [Corynebacterium]ATZ05369.1 WYL domain-containing protein [Corynebacterium striatum]EGT5594333.1 WYL domain-containing protein [Corynebacterium striatum]MCG7250061.1 WYL domain-containing protein [Corynebacterium striatum]MDK8832659.1 WYL domain-containing protein [Corynebacterium striatum]MDK8876246.1 WYL domain-containing protein [Corynebacterium striatum]